MERKKGLIKVSVHLHGAVPGKYVIEMGIPDSLSITGCDDYGPLSVDTFSVNAGGEGQGVGSFVGVPGNTFVVGAFNVDLPEGFAQYVSPEFKLGS